MERHRRTQVLGAPMTAVDREPLVSVILCTYRRPGRLPVAIRSVLEQTLTDLELIVVDDGSGDDTSDIARSIAASDDRVRILINPQNLGVPASRNVGISHATGTYVGFLDDDDEWLPRKLELQVAALETQPTEVGAAWCFARWDHPDGSSTIRTLRLSGSEARRLQRVDIAMLQPLLVRRSALDRVGGFDPQMRSYDDYEWALRFAAAFCFVTVPEVLVVMHRTPGSITTDFEDHIARLDYMLAKHGGWLDRAAISRWQLRRAQLSAQCGDRAGWTLGVRRAIRARPLSVRAWLVLIAGSIAGPGAHLQLARLRNRFGRLVRSFVAHKPT
jgi:glycosyltransferase involved in cell wall biosynthesis